MFGCVKRAPRRAFGAGPSRGVAVRERVAGRGRRASDIVGTLSGVCTVGIVGNVGDVGILTARSERMQLMSGGSVACQ